MIMRSDIRAVYEGGVLRPDAPLDLPEHSRLRIAITVIEEEDEPTAAHRALQEIVSISESGAIRVGAPYPSREELHERGAGEKAA